MTYIALGQLASGFVGGICGYIIYAIAKRRIFEYLMRDREHNPSTFESFTSYVKHMNTAEINSSFFAGVAAGTVLLATFLITQSLIVG
jgi:hypothetical protein